MHMSYRRVPVFVAATAAIVAIPSLVIGQPRNIGPRPPWSDSTPTRIMASAGKGFPSDVVVEVLRQRHQSYSNAKRRELGELAATRAITEPRVGTPAITALSMSGSPDPGLGGVPNLGALDLSLTSEAVEQLEATTAFDIGFPNDFIRDMQSFVYGEVGARVDDRHRAPR